MTLLGRPQSYERSGGSWVDGRYVDGAGTPATFNGTIQPMPARENRGFRDQPTGRFDAGRIRVYSSTPLRAGKEGESRGDVVHFEGSRFEVMKDITHASGIISHYKYIAEYIGEIVE